LGTHAVPLDGIKCLFVMLFDMPLYHFILGTTCVGDQGMACHQSTFLLSYYLSSA